MNEIETQDIDLGELLRWGRWAVENATVAQHAVAKLLALKDAHTYAARWGLIDDAMAPVALALDSSPLAEVQALSVEAQQQALCNVQSDVGAAGIDWNRWLAALERILRLIDLFR